MSEPLPLRPTGPGPPRCAVPVVAPAGLELRPAERPRVYIAPLGSRADELALRASLEAAGLGAPRWSARRRGQVRAERLRQAFLASEPVLVPLELPRRGPDRLARLLRWAQEAGSEVELVPAEILWGPAGTAPSLVVLLAGNPYAPPGWLRWLWLLGGSRRRVRLILGQPGRLSDLAREAGAGEDAIALSAHVRGQAVKALSRAQRGVLGERYKVPRFAVEQILAETEVRDRIARAGARIGLTRAEALRRAEGALRELATGHDFLAMEVFRRFCRWLYTRVYDAEIAVDPRALERLRELGRESPLVFVPSHKSHFDHAIMYSLLASVGLPPPHTAAGNNMAFFPMNRLLPRTGAYFIRRSFQDDPVYRECLAGLIDFLVERGFHQEFFIEGGRTRSGKLLPPRYGMVRYIVDGARRRRVSDARFVPVSIAYDELLEVDDYTRELQGATKERESFGFLVRMLRSLRGRDLGRVHVRFGEPVALRAYLEESGDDRLVVEKLAFRIAHGINEVTTVTAGAAVCSALLGSGRRALTLPELERQTERIIDFVTERELPAAPELGRGPKATVEAATRALCRSGVLRAYEGGEEPVYRVADGRRLVASYYRNTVLHFFLIPAIAALARNAARDGERDPMAWALRLRELLKFEFFFRPREAYRAEVQAEAEALERETRTGLPPLAAAGPGILLDYLESYWVATEVLRSLPPGDIAVSGDELLQRCQSLGRQRLLQERVHAPELLSNPSFANALRLAANLGAARAVATGYARGDPRALAALARDLTHLATAARS